MELRHSRHRKYRGQWVESGDPVRDYTDEQASRLVESGQAYWIATPDEFVNMSDTKAEIQKYMDKYNIPYTDDMTKSQLLERIDDYER